ncbi:SPOC domain-containing protein 1 isoform X2 [Hyla sarda]|uniref:SPOC domain-containing protein 1 isoform X2 n=1 Tax=Hyla sarda TaxID=327740 RepID=UPI0024C3B8AC|nr:SPOC domain-containing protein 1 isoform X2 [Hyla sarda]
MDKLHLEDPSKQDDRDCHSPLGLFEKFKVEFSSEAVSIPNANLQLPSGSESLSTLETQHPMVTPQNVKKLIPEKSSLLKRMRWMMDMASAASNRREDESCALLGSWNADSKEVEILDELESPSNQKELDHQIIIQDVSDNDDVIFCGDYGHISQKKVQFLFDVARSPDNLQVSDPKMTKRKLKKKTHDSEKAHDFDFLPSTKSPKIVRDTTVQALSEVLIKRVKEIQNLDVSKETLKKLAENIEEEIFCLYHDTGLRYKTKYRSLLFNLKDPKNNAFFQHVVLGNIIPQRLVQMSPTEMARQELTDWRNQERLHSLEIIEKAEKELNQHQQKIKLTHKGLIEIDTSPDQMFTLEDLSDSSWFSKDLQDSEVEKRSKIDTTAQHKSHLLDLNCLICMGKVKPSDMMDMNQWTNVKLPLKTTTENSDVEKLLSLEAGEAIENDALAAKSRNTCSSQSVAWKGFIQMFAIKQFKVTASQVSGYSDHLCQKLPKMITSKGFICQESVWEYVELIWPASTKDMCLLRFCPQTSSDAVFYSRLFSYLNRKVRYVIVNTDKMEAFVIPLPACQPIPSQLRPLGGPGLADDHPHLLLALLLPNHPFWSSCPRKVIKIHREEELDVPDDIFSSILEDVEREEKQMTEQGLPPIGNESSRVTEVGMPELMNILCFLSNNLQEIAAQNNSFQIGPPDNQPNPIPTAAPVWPSYLMAPGFQAPASNNNPAAMFDPSTMFGPSGFNPSL